MAAANNHPKIVKMLDAVKNRMQQKSMDAGRIIKHDGETYD